MMVAMQKNTLDILTPKQVAYWLSRFIDVSERTIQRYVHDGRIPSIIVSGRYFVKKSIVKAIIKTINDYDKKYI